MLVTKLERQKKKKGFNVHIDGEFALSVDADTLLEFRSLKVGSEIDEEELDHIKRVCEKRSAYARAFACISRSMHTQREIKNKLKKHAYTDEAIDYALSRLTELNLINDEAYAKAYVETRTGRGRLRLKSELTAKGVEREVIDSVLAEYLDEDEEIISATELARKFYASLGDKTKVMRRLLTRGYSYSVIESAVARALSDDDYE